MFAWLGRKREQRGRRRAAALAAIPLEAADRIATHLMHVAPTPHPIDVSTARAIEAYSADFVRRAAGLAFHFPDLAFPTADAWVTSSPEARLVAVITEAPVFAIPGSLRVRSSEGELSAPSLPHLVCDVLLSLSELEELAADPGGWAPPIDPPPPERLPGSPLATRALPIASDLVAGAIALGLALGGLALLAGWVFADPARDARWIVLALFGTLLGLFAWEGAKTVHRVLWLELRARRLRVGEDGLTHPRTGERIAWVDLREVVRRRSGTWRVVLSDGTRVALPSTTFVDPKAALAEVTARRARVRTSYRA